MRSKMRLIVPLTLILGSIRLLPAEARGAWLAKVPSADRERVNPLAADPGALPAGSRLYAQHCASCHGRSAEGIGRRPALDSARVHAATDGELQWLLRNGSLAAGMPAWSSLPEVQRWQLVRYLHSLPMKAEQNR